MSQRINKVVMLLIAIIMTMSLVLVACEDDDNIQYYDNENDPIVFSTLEVDKVFNPFFSTSGTDSNIVGMTQMGMLSNDQEGKIVYGDDEPVVVKDLQIETKGVQNVDQTTTYLFVLKNNIKFSNGSALSIKDVLFNLYVYLDPAYTGSSTIYSTDIVGLKEYRTQESDETEQDRFEERFNYEASSRIDNLVMACQTVIDQDTTGNLTVETFSKKLGEVSGAAYANAVKDFTLAVKLFGEELESDWNNALGSYQDIKFTDSTGKVHENLLTTDVESFLYNEGYITWNKKTAELSYALGTAADIKTWTKEKAIETVFNALLPYDIEQIVRYWATATNLHESISKEAMEEYFADKDRTYPNISGIKFANRTEGVVVNGQTYAVPTYNSYGELTAGNEVLSITINDVDPKAIWNFSFSVAPMYYYSDAVHIAAFDYESNFGVEHGSQTFMDKVVKNPDRIGVPVGAGAYAASKSSGGLENVQAGDFYNLGVIYFERNPHFLMGPAKIKKVRFQVVPAIRALDALYTKAIDFAEPNAKPETINELKGKESEGFGSKNVATAGYGYIGINAGRVPTLAVRQAIMHSINTLECVNYYKTAATPIHRSMSFESWAYPKGATAYYPYIGGPVPSDLTVVNPDYAQYVTQLGKKAGDTLTLDEQKAFLVGLIEGAGYTLNGYGVYQNGQNVLKYQFTIAGEETDHPAYNAMLQGSNLLNSIGMQTNVTTDSQALKKLTTGDLTVWAAAWGSTIDPDMYQVYHKDSNATSVNNWGYKQIKQNNGGKYDTELALIEELSELIEAGRNTTVESQRARIYSEALDLVMQLAIELPTYQRDDLFAYNARKIDVSTFTSFDQLSPYKGLTSKIYNISLIAER